MEIKIDRLAPEINDASSRLARPALGRKGRMIGNPANPGRIFHISSSANQPTHCPPLTGFGELPIHWN